MAAFRIRVPGLSSMIVVLNKMCKVILKWNQSVRLFVPDESKAGYDLAIEALLAACDQIKSIEYQDASSDTNAPWGDR
jgi:ADP-heptose:LPS heptosyltransferase